MDRRNKDIISVKCSFFSLRGKYTTELTSLFSLYQSKVISIASNCIVHTLSSDFTECSHTTLTPLLADVDGAVTPSPQILCSSFLSLSYAWKAESPVQSSRDDNIADLKYMQLSFIPKSCPKIFWDSNCLFPKEGVKMTASMRQFGLLRASQIQWVEVIKCHLGFRLCLCTEQGKEDFYYHAVSNNVLEKQWVFSLEMYIVPMWLGSLHPFGMRVHQNRQIPRVRCYQQGHYQLHRNHHISINLWQFIYVTASFRERENIH